jgi:FMN phosphatase YigB (HAD superfamily)
MSEAVIFDMDGTLADVSGMRHYLTDDPRRKNFDLFHKSACLFAPVNQRVVSQARFHAARGRAILIVTARKRMWGDYTKMWLDKHSIPYERIYMRANDDYRRDYEVKRDILARIRSQGFDVVHAYDDNPNVIKLWTEEGIPTTVVPGWIPEVA